MEQTLENGIADNLLHNIFNDLSVGLELYDKDGLMIDVNYSRLRSMGIKDKKDILGYNLFNYTSFSDEIKEQVRKGETVRFMAKYNFDDVRHLFPTNLSGIKFFEITVSFVHNEKSILIRDWHILRTTISYNGRISRFVVKAFLMRLTKKGSFAI